jgi:hypothetical protein
MASTTERFQATQLAALVIRLTDANDHLLLMYYQNGLHFYRRQNGTYTLLASSAPFTTNRGGEYHRLEDVPWTRN